MSNWLSVKWHSNHGHERQRSLSRLKKWGRRKSGRDVADDASDRSAESRQSNTDLEDRDVFGMPEKPSLEVAVNEDSQIIDDNDAFWRIAFERFMTKPENDALVADFNRLVPCATQAELAASIEDGMRRRESRQWKLDLSSTTTIKLSDVGRDLVKFTLWSTSQLKTVASADPYAALAWTCVAVALPLFLKAPQQTETIQQGLADICDVLRLYKVYSEDSMIYGEDKRSSIYRESIIGVLYGIFEYQANVVVHLSHSTKTRSWHAIRNKCDWKGMSTKIKNDSEFCLRFQDVNRRLRQDQALQQQAQAMQMSVMSLSAILEELKINQSRNEDISRAQMQEKKLGQIRDMLGLFYTKYANIKDVVVPERTDGTLDWFFATEEWSSTNQHRYAPFLAWTKRHESGLFWISAKPGFGKSVLAKTIVEEQDLTEELSDYMMTYFFFRDNKSSAESALSAILHQIFSQNPMLDLQRYVKNYSADQLRNDLSILWQMLMDVLQDPVCMDIVCVLDALDECPKRSRKFLISKILSLLKMASEGEQHVKIRFIVTSRPYDDIKTEMMEDISLKNVEHFDGIECLKDVKNDVNTLIESEIPKIFSGSQKSEAIRRMQGMDNRDYLWVSVVLELLHASPSTFRRPGALDALLSELPSDVYELYEKILSRISGSHQLHEARTLLSLVVAAKEPMHVDDMNHAFAMTLQLDHCRKIADLETLPRDTLSEDLINISGLFLQVSSSKVLSLFHQTARDYLIDEKYRDPTKKDSWGGSIDVEEANFLLCRACIRYLLLEDSPVFFNEFESGHLRPRDFHYYLAESRERESRIADAPWPYFALYAAAHWHYHFNNIGDANKAKVADELAEFCDGIVRSPDKTRFLTNHYDALPFLEFNHLSVATLLGYRPYIESLLKTKYLDSPDRIEIIATALRSAAAIGNIEFLKMYLEMGCPIDSTDEFGNSPLSLAVHFGHVEIVEHLFLLGLDVTSPVLRSQSHRFLRSLYQSFVFADIGNSQADTALVCVEDLVYLERPQLQHLLRHSESTGRWEVAMKIEALLSQPESWGAPENIGARSRCANEALSLAIRANMVAMSKFLVERGADVNFSEELYGRSPLAYAIKQENLEIVNMLLARGAIIKCPEEDEPDLERALSTFPSDVRVGLIWENRLNVADPPTINGS